MAKHHQIIVVGGGNAGISVSAQLLRRNGNLDIAIIEPSDKHYYQPAWTLVGGGDFDILKTVRPMESVMPPKVKWIKERCASFQPEENQITLANGEKLTYDFLIVAAGIQLDWDKVKGLKETLGKNGVCSNYSYETAPYTFECIKNLKQGKAIFHNPHTPVKCGGAPHKIMYLAADYFRKHGVLDKIDIQYWSGAAKLFAVPKYEKTLLEVVKRGNIKLNFMQKLEEIDAQNKRARFVGIGENNKDQETWVEYDMIHVTPPQSAPDFIKTSPLANAGGWVDVNVNTLQHNKYKNIFSLGDSSGLPTSKTGAAIRKQAPILVANLMSAMEGKPLVASYNGYTSCPLVTGYGKLVLAEFDYNQQPQETFPFDQSKERWSMYQLKRHVLPWLYWNKILKGTA
ncbi:MAG: pyridine nucleotide-disulfide oxidoreductase [Bacteroidia bacterium]|jgi:sulfide:quinone oxidoreductase|nr:MAG: pyridine nucleotide-disulfide oxidoreductase [Bacteroidia bacterium]